MTTTPTPTDHAASVPTLAISDLIPVVEAELRAERDAARDELAKTRAELDELHAESRRLGDQANHLVQQVDAACMARQRIADAHHKHVDAHGGTWGECNECGNSWPCPTYVWATTNRDPLATWDPADDDPTQPLAEANPATTAEPAALPLLPDIAHMTTQLPDDDEDVPLMAVGIIPNCARCDAPMFVGHRCPAEPADEPKATNQTCGHAYIGNVGEFTCDLYDPHPGKHWNSLAEFEWADEPSPERAP